MIGFISKQQDKLHCEQLITITEYIGSCKCNPIAISHLRFCELNLPEKQNALGCQVRLTNFSNIQASWVPSQKARFSLNQSIMSTIKTNHPSKQIIHHKPSCQSIMSIIRKQYSNISEGIIHLLNILKSQGLSFKAGQLPFLDYGGKELTLIPSTFFLPLELSFSSHHLTPCSRSKNLQGQGSPDCQGAHHLAKNVL